MKSIKAQKDLVSAAEPLLVHSQTSSPSSYGRRDKAALFSLDCIFLSIFERIYIFSYFRYKPVFQIFSQTLICQSPCFCILLRYNLHTLIHTYLSVHTVHWVATNLYTNVISLQVKIHNLFPEHFLTPLSHQQRGTSVLVFLISSFWNSQKQMHIVASFSLCLRFML
jgi:hypothetical protein